MNYSISFVAGTGFLLLNFIGIQELLQKVKNRKFVCV